MRQGIANFFARKKLGKTPDYIVSSGADLEPIRDDELDRRTAFIRRTMNILFVLCAVISGYITTVGVQYYLEQTGGLGWQHTMLGIAFAIAITTLQASLWWICFSIIEQMRNRALKSATFLWALLVLAWVFAVSTMLGVQGFTGESALILDLQAKTDSLEEGISSTSEYRRLVESSLPAVQAQSNALCSLASAEGDRGVVTGAAGGGPVASALLSSCELLRTFSQAISERGTEDASTAVPQGHLDAINEGISNPDLSVRERIRLYEQHGRAIQAWAREARGSDITQILRNASQMLSASVLSVVTGDSAFGQKQNEAVQGLNSSVQGIADGLRAIADEIDGYEIPSLKYERPVPITLATIEHWKPHFTVWAAVAGIDGFPMVVLLSLMLADGGRLPRTRKLSPFDPLLTIPGTVPGSLLPPSDDIEDGEEDDLDSDDEEMDPNSLFTFKDDEKETL